MNIDVDKLKEVLNKQQDDINGIYYETDGIIGVIDGSYIRITTHSAQCVEDEFIDAPEKADIVITA